MLTSISEDYVRVLERGQTCKNKKNQSEATNLEAAWVNNLAWALIQNSSS